MSIKERQCLFVYVTYRRNRSRRRASRPHHLAGKLRLLHHPYARRHHSMAVQRQNVFARSLQVIFYLIPPESYLSPPLPPVNTNTTGHGKDLNKYTRLNNTNDKHVGQSLTHSRISSVLNRLNSVKTFFSRTILVGRKTTPTN